MPTATESPFLTTKGSAMAADGKATPRPQIIPGARRLENVPWWLLILILAGLLLVFSVFTSERYQDAFRFLIAGVEMTIFLTLVSFALSVILGLLAGLGRVSRNQVIYTIATLYVEVIRGVPLLVQLIYWAFVVTPAIVSALNALGQFILSYLAYEPLLGLAYSLSSLSIQNVDMTGRCIAGLAFGYGAYEAEIFRAGIQSIPKGQMEAARSLGMSHYQAMRHIILPQAIRVVLPPLGNDFVAMLKDTSLVSALAVRELTQLGKLYRGRTFRSFETWNTVSFIYLSMTIVLSLLVRSLERRMRTE